MKFEKRVQLLVGIGLLAVGLSLFVADRAQDEHVGLWIAGVGLLLLPLDFTNVREAWDRFRGRAP